jgi:hypothetical protein
MQVPEEKDFKLIEINVKNDPLLINEKYNLFSANEIINVYRIFSLYDKDVLSLTDNYHLDTNCKDIIMHLLTKRYKTINRAAKVLLGNLEVYREKRYSSKIKEKWRVKDNLIKGNITLEYARVISLILGKDKEESIEIFNKLLLKSKFFLTHKKKQVKCPMRFSDLNCELAYLAGVIAGDGHIDRALHVIKIVDGHVDKSLKKYSYEYLKKLNKIIKRNFNCDHYKEKIEGNYFVFRYNSSLFCRIMNYIYQIPKGNKSREIVLPNLIKNSPNEQLFWRGVFDADGSIRPKNKGIRLTTISKRLYDDFLSFCEKKKIKIFNKEKNRQYHFLVVEEGIPRFARLIGSSHPRKQKNLIEYLKKGASYNIPVRKKQNRRLDPIIEFLRPYKNIVYVKLTKKREMVSNQDIKKRIQFIGENLNQKIIELRRPRKNNHFYICSMDLVREINEYYDFRPIWDPFNDEEIDDLKQRWYTLRE